MTTSPGGRPEQDAGVGFALRVPPSWFELDLSPATRDAAAAALVDGRVREQPDLRPHRATVSRLLREQAREAWDAGARYCACLVEPTEDGPVTASVTVSVVAGPLGVDPAGQAYLDALMAPLVSKERAGEDDTWLAVDAVELPGGLGAARAWGVEDLDLPHEAGWLRVVQLQQLVPVPGVNRVVVLTCTSPVLPLTDVLLDLFTAVAETLEVVRTPR